MIDLWGVGCVLAYLYISEHLFDVLCPYQMVELPQTNVEQSGAFIPKVNGDCMLLMQMKCMVAVRGQPKEHLLRTGKYTNLFFSPVETPEGPTWRMNVA